MTGSIAAYKIASLASSLVKLHADVHVLMTQNATNFINPITFETLTGNKCLVDTFDRNFQFDVTHVSLAKKADVMLIAPASANVIGKIAGGIADDMPTTTVMASTAPVLISPAMNTHMYENPIVQDNLEKLRRSGTRLLRRRWECLPAGMWAPEKCRSRKRCWSGSYRKSPVKKTSAAKRF
ncbi:MAG: flavoprotein [Ruminococcus callidus]